ncbi:Vacuolar transporter chaperone 4, partial [Lachnellula cervina]
VKTSPWQIQPSGARGQHNILPGFVVMKFGEQLRSSIIDEYEWYYIAYDDLKKTLKKDYVSPPTKQNPKPKRQEWTEEDEGEFISRIEQELDKVYTKQKLKIIEISRRIGSTEKEVKDVVQRMESRRPRARDGSAAQDDDEPDSEDFMLLEEDLNEITAEVNDLAKFVQLNYTGFQKIIKKHDKQTKWILKPVFATRLKAKPFFKDNYDSDIIKLSKLWDTVKSKGKPVTGDSAAGGSQGSFIRQTTKYWVHKDNITEVKLIIMKHLPVLVFNSNKEFDEKDAAITSIYYDNPEVWDLYEGRLKKTEGAEAIRLRWYGGMDTETIFVERKTHREDWTGEKSVKARFAMKEKNVNAYLKGALLPEAIFEKARKDGKKPAAVINEDERLAKEIQYSILKKGYKPVCRSFYHRTAFQLPADARVRISLDTELTMVREDNLDGRARAGDNWRRMDIGIDFPFSQLPPEDVEIFPYAVLEVKLQTQSGQEPPDWVRQLIASHLVEAVPKFSKFIHGTATLFPTRINLIPFWFPQMDIDIRKPATHNFGIHHAPRTNTTNTTSDDEDDDSDDDYDISQGSSTAVANGSDENVNQLRKTRDELGDRDLQDRVAGNSLDIEEQLAALPLNEDYPLYDSDEEDDEVEAIEEARRIGGWSYYSKVLKKHARLAGQSVLSALRIVKPIAKPTEVPRNGMQAQLGEGRIVTRRFKAPKGKKIHVPVRVEPKVYFAAERTFLSWLEISIWLALAATTLLNFGDKPSRMSFFASGSLTAIAAFFLLYSVGVYMWRSYAIRTRKAIKYHDKFGPTILCVMLVLTLVLNAVFELKQREFI